MAGDKKLFVLDTNVLLHNANSIRAFGDNLVVIPIDVIEELDQFKKDNTDIGRNAREVIRALDKLRRNGNLGTGVPVDGTGGMLRVEVHTADFKMESGLQPKMADNRIIAAAFRLQQEGYKVFLVSKDMNMRVKAEAVGLKAMDFEQEKVNIDELYMGWRELVMERSKIEEYREKRRIEVDTELYANEFVLFRDRDDPKHTALGRCADDASNMVVHLRYPEKAAGITARNLQQRLALEALLDDNIRLVTLVGQAGTGKTLLALAAGYQRVREGAYERLLVSRPIMPLGKDLGYLPGTKEEKLEHWMQPIYDNMKFLLRERGEPGDVGKRVVDLIKQRIIEMEALTYIRGRSIYRQFLVVDEAQNLTPHEVKTVISRAGHETKLVLTGDPYQIDNPYLDSNSNGLCYVVERLKDQRLMGHVTLLKSERSRLAHLAATAL